MSITVDRIIRQKATLGGTRVSLEIESGEQTETIECSYEMAPRLVQAIQQAAIAAEALRKLQPNQTLEIVHAHNAIDVKLGSSLNAQTICLRILTDIGVPLEVSMN